MFPENITKLHFAIFKFNVIFAEDVTLPYYKGTMLRKSFGFTFKKTVCTMAGEKCGNCLLKVSCPYAYIFKSCPSDKSRFLTKYPSVPQPYIFEFPAEEKKDYKRGENFEFNLILIGKAISYLPYFVYAFKEIGRKGLLPGRGGRYIVEKVVNCNFLFSRNYLIYNGKYPSVRTPEYITRTANLNEVIEKWEEIDEVKMTFLTPARIKYREKLVSCLEFHIFMRSFLRRLSSLFYFHCGEELVLDYKGLIERAGSVKILESNLYWQDIYSHNSSRKEKIKLGGFKGEVTFLGNLKDFIVFILLGKYFHLGKNITYGLGRYEVLI